MCGNQVGPTEATSRAGSHEELEAWALAPALIFPGLMTLAGPPSFTRPSKGLGLGPESWILPCSVKYQ